MIISTWKLIVHPLRSEHGNKDIRSDLLSIFCFSSLNLIQNSQFRGTYMGVKWIMDISYNLDFIIVFWDYICLN